MPSSEPTLIAGRYRFDRVLGSGAMGRVWLAFDELIERPVAIKQLIGIEPEAQAVERAMREARAAGSLRHPNAVTVYDLVVVDHLPFVVMEYINGVSLERRLQDGPSSPFEVADIGRQISAALSAAHDLGIVHRDVKPANILIEADGTAKLADFGIARTQSHAALTGTGHIIGTVAYMPPEIAEGKPATAASDVWSLGATLFAALEGRTVFEGTTPVAILAQLITKPIPFPRSPGPLADAIGAMLARDPARRPSATDARASLEAAAGMHHAKKPNQRSTASTTVTLPPASPDDFPPTLLASTSPPARRRTRWALAAATVVVLGVAGGIVALRAGSHDTPADGIGTNAASHSPAGSRAALANQGTQTDAAHDGVPDILSTSWSVGAATLTVSAVFGPTSQSYFVQFNFDLDGNSSDGCGGTDYAVAVFSDSSQVHVTRDSSCASQKEIPSQVVASMTPTKITISVPRAELIAAKTTVPLTINAYPQVTSGAGDTLPPILLPLGR